MIYIITNKSKAENYGFSSDTHIVSGNLMCLNEKEVMATQTLNGTLSERVKTLGGKQYTLAEARSKMKI